MALEIRPLHFGTLSVDKSGLTLRKDLGTRVAAPCLGFLILGGEAPLLVDTGPSMDPEWAGRYHNPLQRPEGQSLPAQLAIHGLGVEDIRDVILTHLHWDHCYGNVELPDARFFVQKTEVNYAGDPLPCDAPIYETNLSPVHFHSTQDRFECVDGAHHFAEGIDLIPLPGHSPGLQGVLVKTALGRWLIASDHFPLLENYETGVPTGIVYSLSDWYEATKRARSLEARILPGHDICVLDRHCYK